MVNYPTNSAVSVSEVEINTSNGAVTTKGPITVTPVSGTRVIGFAYDPSLPGWRLLVSQPT